MFIWKENADLAEKINLAAMKLDLWNNISLKSAWLYTCYSEYTTVILKCDGRNEIIKKDNIDGLLERAVS